MKTTLGVACFFFGYLLVYAAIADHGKFAYQPWEGVRSIAYDVPAPDDPGGEPA